MCQTHNKNQPPAVTEFIGFADCSWYYIFLPYINNLPDYVMCNIAIFANDNTLYSECDNTPGLLKLEY